METAQKQRWSYVVESKCACGRCMDCRRQAKRERIARAYEDLFLGCDTAVPDRADKALLLTAA